MMESPCVVKCTVLVSGVIGCEGKPSNIVALAAFFHYSICLRKHVDHKNHKELVIQMRGIAKHLSQSDYDYAYARFRTEDVSTPKVPRNP